MEEHKNQNNTDFMKETIKQRPLNRRKLVRRTLLTAAMAVIFGMVACFTFLLLEPVISNRLYPEEEPQMIEFIEETEEDEILPEDMFVDDSQMEPEPTEPPALEDEQIAQVLSEMQLGVEDYLSLIAGIREVAQEAQRSIVTVVGVTPDVGWLDNEFENEGAVSGLVVADNGIELLILADVNSIEDAESLEVVFQDGEVYEASIMKKDNNTGLAVISITKITMKSSTMEMAAVASLGTSNTSLVGVPVIALGRPMGTEGSLCYGNITSTGNGIRLPDSNYKFMTTDIYGSSNASGVLVNLRGQVIGFVDMSHNSTDLKNLISAVGISDIKRVLQSLSNDKDIAYFGVYGVDVTEAANQELEVHFGAYIIEIDMDSPAMEAGIQSGDVIIKWNDLEIVSYQDLVNALLMEEPEGTSKITLMRQGPEGYIEMEATVVLGMK